MAKIIDSNCELLLSPVNVMNVAKLVIAHGRDYLNKY